LHGPGAGAYGCLAVQLTDVEKRRRLPWCVASTGLNSFFAYMTFFSSVFVLFLSDLGFPKSKVGFLMSLFPFTGLLALVVVGPVFRFGLKRTFIVFFGIRKLLVFLLVPAPWLISRFGRDPAFVFVAAVVLAFAVCRAVAETAFNPWMQEFVPNAIRGRYQAVQQIVGGLMGALALFTASRVLGRVEGTGGYMVLLSVGAAVGLCGVLLATKIPGGIPDPDAHGPGRGLSEMRDCLRDRQFLLYLGGAGCATLAILPITAFLPLFMKEQIGLPAPYVVMLDTAALVGGLVSTLAWGWAADRYGSRPVLLTGLSMFLVLPFAWFSLPRGGVWAARLAMTYAFLYGVCFTGLTVGGLRLLYNRIVPAERRGPYMAIWYAWIGIVGGCAPFAAGFLLERLRGVSLQAAGFHVDAFAALFLAAILLGACAIVFYSRIEHGGEMGTREFLGLFLRGNPFLGLWSLWQYSRSLADDKRLAATRRMGDVRSALNTNELLEALDDPSFDVRVEALLAVARGCRDPRLVAALLDIVDQNHPELSALAALAAGRLGDPAAVPRLRNVLQSGVSDVEAAAARSLAALGDADAVPLFLDRLHRPSPISRLLPYAAALGLLRSREALAPILRLIGVEDEDPLARRELAMAAARILGAEQAFVRLWRRFRSDGLDAIARRLHAVQRRRRHAARPGFLPASSDPLDDSIRRFAEGDAASGVGNLASAIAAHRQRGAPDDTALVLDACVRAMRTYGDGSAVYILLALALPDVDRRLT